MARPQKQGMEWFPCETTFNQDFKALEELHGNDGFTWLIKFWQTAYKTDNGIVDLSGIRGVIVAKTARVSFENQAKIISDCLEIGLLLEISPSCYTSDGIIRRHIKANKKREYDRNLRKNELSLREQYDNGVKSTQSRVDIEKSIEDINTDTWKKSFDEYKKEMSKQFDELCDDEEWEKQRQEYHPQLDIKKTIQKAMDDYWFTQAGWKNKKSRKTTDIDLKRTLNYALSQKCNQVWKKD